MATIKAYTDISQSKKLAEILPFESADMYYDGFGRLPQGYAYTLIHPNSFEYDKPCWSLAALLNILKYYTLQTNGDGTVFVIYEGKKIMMSDCHINAVDACYQIILKLHELKML